MPLSRADLLAVHRTVLANERTFLAYFRTGAALLTSGVAIQSIDFFVKMRGFAQLLLWCAPLVLVVGVSRFFVVRRQVKAIAQPTPSEEVT